MFDVLAGRKKVLDVTELIPTMFPNFKEFSLEALVELCNQDSYLKSFLPNLTAKKGKHSRKFVCTILASLRPNFIKQAIEHAHT